MFQLLLAVIYLAFISLGLPDSLLGSAWPTMYREFSVPVSYAGGISMIIAVGTIVSSLLSDRLTKRFGAGKITAVSVFMTAAALFGFSTSHTFIALCLWAVPYGLGAGCVDAALNNYVALHYTSRHMSWLHCMWGVGASLGPYIMGYALSNGHSWNMGYRYISILQILLTAVLLFSLPLWKKPTVPAKSSHTAASSHEQALSLSQIVRISGAKEIMITFFCYCALEFLCGTFFSLDGIPRALKLVVDIMPLTHTTRLIREISFGGSVNFLSMGVSALFVAVFTGCSVWACYREAKA